MSLGVEGREMMKFMLSIGVVPTQPYGKRARLVI
jgi:hypothetical protein